MILIWGKISFSMDLSTIFFMILISDLRVSAVAPPNKLETAAWMERETLAQNYIKMLKFLKQEFDRSCTCKK